MGDSPYDITTHWAAWPSVCSGARSGAAETVEIGLREADRLVQRAAFSLDDAEGHALRVVRDERDMAA